MQIKKGASLQGLQLVMRKVLVAADAIYKEYMGYEQTGCIVTSGTDGEHSAGSLHYYGYALDFRVWALSEDEKEEICQKLREELGDKYDVVNEHNHIHVEFDDILK